MNYPFTNGISSKNLSFIKVFIRESCSTFHFSVSEYILMNRNYQFDSSISPLFLSSELPMPLMAYYFILRPWRRKVGEDSGRKDVGAQKERKDEIKPASPNSAPLSSSLPRGRTGSLCSPAQHLEVWIWLIKRMCLAEYTISSTSNVSYLQ